MKTIIRIILSIVVALSAGANYYIYQNIDNLTHRPKPEVPARPLTPTEKRENKISDIIAKMTLDEKVDQLLMVQQRASDWSSYSGTKYGGIIVGSKSSYNNLGVIGSTSAVRPFIATDDEGGTVERAATGYPNARDFNGNLANITETETRKTKYLLSKNINLNLSPDTDIISDSRSALYKRSYGGTPELVSSSVKAVIKARNANPINGITLGSVLKHYPGYPASSINTDFAEARDNRTAAQIQPNIDTFVDCAKSGALGIMTSNVIYQNLDPNSPASLSNTIISRLRARYDGVIMTDDISAAQGVSKIAQRYQKAFLAGNDMILVWQSGAQAAHNEIYATVKDNKAAQAQLDASLRRILGAKIDLGLIQY